VNFIKVFTAPKETDGELWRVSKEPFIVVHLSLQKKAKKKEAKKPVKGKEKKEEESEEIVEEADDKNRVIYKPSLGDCKNFVLNSMKMVCKSTNLVNNLEADLMPFLQKIGYPNFEINADNQWIKDANERLTTLVDENVTGPEELLEKYKKYEYIFNVDKKELIDTLFKGETKKTLAEIKEQVSHYDQAHYDIMTLSEDEIDFNVFKIITKKLKNELGEQAQKLKDKILEATYNWCNEVTVETRKTFATILQKIDHDPVNERELIDTKDFIASCPQQVEKLNDTLKEVYKHHLMLEEFSYMYEEKDIDNFWYMKIWPLRIQAGLTEGKNRVTDKSELFVQNLEKEKEKFQKDIDSYKAAFEKMKTFNNLNQAQEFSTDAYTLKDQIQMAFEKKKQFNEREEIFGQPVTLYPEIDTLNIDFKPFYDLTTMAYNCKTDFNEWINN